MTENLIKKKNLDPEADMHREKATWRHREQTAIHKPTKDATEEYDPAKTLIWLLASKAVRQ